ncbi:unnamed protein product [Caenorhabditis bovis]|uniref:Exostosin GT47 domain-containing protein n=1 Tax=Caenorhabditis bovis TaxID=2654633 RepID=A0A8S1F0T9_9PELO|nr:unnamed protein product [Caenorhabditis bovis]
MQNCFDFQRCQFSRKLYIHPVVNEFEQLPKSQVWQRMLQYFQNSEYYTDDPNEACLFLLGIDTTDRDIRSQNYVKNVPEYIAQLDQSVWNDGRNHLIFNFYHGTFPDYDDHNLNFDTGLAMIARASANDANFFKGFDISLPLFHDNHPYESEPEKLQRTSKTKSQYLVSFKGKRYVYGIGSSTRNLVHHLHNAVDIVMVTTCKHNNDWQVYQDDRCAHDNQEYEKWDYDALLSNSTFCLVPRGRRLGSFRFLETLRSGCIPVIVSDSWVLPYSEIIDWSTAAITVREKDALMIPAQLMSMSRRRVDALRENAAAIYDAFLRSVSMISETALKIVHRRIDAHFSNV